MAMQTGVATSKVLILVGAGLTGSVILKSGRLSDLISQLQEVINGVNAAETSPGRYDTALLAAQIRQLAQDIREMSISNPITIYKDSSSSGSYASYILPAAAVGAMGYCYMKWKASTRRLCLSMLNIRCFFMQVSDVKANLNQIGFDINLIYEMVSGLEGKIELLESKQDVTNSGLWYLCQVAGGIKDGENPKVIQGIEAKLIEHSKVTPKENWVKGLEFIAESNESSVPPKSVTDTEGKVLSDNSAKGPVASKMRIHRSYPVGLSLTRNVLGPGF
uniref:DUF1664 domain-containing protein n=1 Tax=Nicotiana tabacum TaxID=4097 RepID=A0A1S4A0B7_TOBAC|nr:PREDICTED: uncharacterized protein LOC107792350 [Nicotiana tabacum]